MNAKRRPVPYKPDPFLIDAENPELTGAEIASGVRVTRTARQSPPRVSGMKDLTSDRIVTLIVKALDGNARRFSAGLKQKEPKRAAKAARAPQVRAKRSSGRSKSRKTGTR